MLTNLLNIQCILFISSFPATAVAEHTNNEPTPRKSRKRQKHPENWKRNKRSMSYNSGNNKKVKLGCNCNCKKGCGEKFSENDRQQIFSDFWGLKCQKRRRDFVVSHVERKSVDRHRVKQPEFKRKYSLVYRLPQVHGPQLQVCKNFFLNTLSISSRL